MNKDLVLVYPTQEAADHWMSARMFKRAGVDHTMYTKIVADPATVLQAIRPYKVALVFGEQALQNVLGVKDILRWFYREVPLKLEGNTVTVIPCLDPAMLLPYTPPKVAHWKDLKENMRHPPRYQGKVMECIHKAVRVAADGPTVPLPTHYLEDPSPERFNQWVDDFYKVADPFTTILSWDIETPYKLEEENEEELEERKQEEDNTILRYSFSYVAGSAVSVPNSAEYRDGIKRLLLWSGFHAGWNIIGFDVPKVVSNGLTVGGKVLDGMDAWKLLYSDLDKGLEHVTSFCTDLLPWKHLSDTFPAKYSCIDADAALRNVLVILEELRKIGLYDRFMLEMDLMHLLGEAGRRGNNINNEFRLEFKAELESLLYTKVLEAQSLVAEKFVRRKLMARIPKGADPADYGTEVVKKKVNCCSLCGKLRVSVKHKCEKGELWQKQSVVLDREVYYILDPLKTISSLPGLLKYLKQAGFNPCSANQMKLYMKLNRHPVGTNHKTKQDTADVKHITKMVGKFGAKHPIYAKTLEIRLIQKALSTYVNGLEPDDQGLIHTSYVNSTSTWRLGSRNINVQNLGKRAGNPYAKKARRIIIPRPGHVFVQADSSSIEAVMVGEFMGDRDYVALARKGIHSYVTGKFLGESFTVQSYTAHDNERIKAAHKVEYDKFKQVNHGTNYGMGPYLMHMNDPITFPHVRDAEEVQEFIFRVLPSLPQWHHELRLFAKKHGYLVNPWGLRHYFYDVFNYKFDDEKRLVLDNNGRPQVKLGKDSKRVIAFKPQSSAGFFMRDNLLLIGRTDLRQYMVPVVSIHDGYTLEVPERLVDYTVQTLGEILTRPIKEMANLRVGCEIGLMTENFLDERHVSTIEVS